MALIFLLIGMLCFGISNCLWRDLQIKYTNYQLLFSRSILTLAILSLIHLIAEEKNIFLNEHTLHQFIQSLPSILISFLGLLFFIQSLKHQASGISGAVVLWSILFGVIFSKIFDNYIISSSFVVVVGLYLTGLLLIDKNILKAFVPTKGTLMALGSGLCWALASRGFKSGIAATNPTAFALFQEATVFIIATSVLTYQKNIPIYKSDLSNTIFKDVALLALLTVGGIIGTNLAFQSSTLIYFTLISAVQPASTVIISKFVQKEEINNRQIAGAILLIIGAALV